jgi:hypothetical protein
MHLVLALLRYHAQLRSTCSALYILAMLCPIVQFMLPSRCQCLTSTYLYHSNSVSSPTRAWLVTPFSTWLSAADAAP